MKDFAVILFLLFATLFVAPIAERLTAIDEQIDLREQYKRSLGR